MKNNSKQFFDTMAPEYNAAIDLCVPRYHEMLWSILYYLPSNWKPKTVLELGCGSGNLSELVKSSFPNSMLFLVDLSEKILQSCRSRLGSDNSIQYLQEDFSKVHFEAQSFDLVVSSIAIHHLADEGKFDLFSKVYEWLRTGGILAYSDQFSAVTQDMYGKHIQKWFDDASAQGLPIEKWNQWMEHQREHDHHTPLEKQMNWMKQIGFKWADCPWRYLLWTVVHARK